MQHSEGIYRHNHVYSTAAILYIRRQKVIKDHERWAEQTQAIYVSHVRSRGWRRQKIVHVHVKRMMPVGCRPRSRRMAATWPLAPIAI